MAMTGMNEHFIYQDVPTFHVIYKKEHVMTDSLKNL